MNAEICSACGAKVVMYRHSLSLPLVRCLSVLAKAGGGPINLSKLVLTRSEWNNFQKLRYFGLVQQVAVDGRHKAGVWEITDRGRRFLAGELAVQKVAVTYRGELEEWDGPKVRVSEVGGLYKLRPDWAAEAIPYGASC